MAKTSFSERFGGAFAYVLGCGCLLVATGLAVFGAATIIVALLRFVRWVWGS